MQFSCVILVLSNLYEHLKKPYYVSPFVSPFVRAKAKKSKKADFWALIQSPFKCYLSAFLIAITYMLFKPQICILNTFHGGYLTKKRHLSLLFISQLTSN